MNKKPKVESFLEEILSKRKRIGGYRSLRLKDENLKDFSSNDYLGLARMKDLAFRDIKFEDNGAGGSRLLSGNKSYHETLENYLANFFEAEAALLFNSGYMANLGVLSSVPQKGDTVLIDELSHICIKEGVRLSRAKYFNFKHNDLGDLELKLKKAKGNKFIVVESVYSMDGDQAPLLKLVALAKSYDAEVIVDEAHSTALYGNTGWGLCCELGVAKDIFARIYTFGKAAGCHGAAVCGSEVLKSYLINYSRQFIYTTALPHHSIVAIANAMEYRKKHAELWEKLKHNIHLFRSNINSSITKLGSSHPIQGILLNNSENAVAFSQYLKEFEFDIRPILSPTVPKGKERVRICLHTFNSEEDITNLCFRINKYFK